MRPFKNSKTVQDARKTRRASTVAGSLLAVNDQDGTQHNAVLRRISVVLTVLFFKRGVILLPLTRFHSALHIIYKPGDKTLALRLFHGDGKGNFFTVIGRK